MASSYRSFNYALRPAKATERKMLIDAFRMLYPFGPISAYKYIGFGSTSFVDFRLIHKELGINRLRSIERDSSSKPRFEFNKPFTCLKLSFGESHDILPELDWSNPSIVWLDYEGGLTRNVLADLATFANKAQVGSVLVVTLNTEQLDAAGAVEDEDAEDEAKNDEIKALQSVVGADRVPQDINLKHFRKWGKADIYARLLDVQLAGFIQDANELDSIRPLTTYCERFAYFQYADNAKMATVAWVLRDKNEIGDAVSNGLKSMDFYRAIGVDAFRIEPPVFTHKELLHLEAQVPRKRKNLQLAGVPDSDLQNYARIYKYYPAFVEAELR
jgi:hypothetical protein